MAKIMFKLQYKLLQKGLHLITTSRFEWKSFKADMKPATIVFDRFRADNMILDFKNLSVREIEPHHSTLPEYCSSLTLPH
jgi:hypothetical protein